jgi:hypothetical protein
VVIDCLALLALVLGAPAAVAADALAAGSATERTPAITIRPLLMEAAARGSAKGVLVGPVAEGIGRSFGSTAPIEVDVMRLSELAEAGCARLRVVTRQAGVRPGVASAPAMAPSQTLTYEISYCASGRFPVPASGAAPRT